MNDNLNLPMELDAPEKQQIGMGIFYNFVSFFAIPFFAYFLIADLQDEYALTWFEAGFHIINFVVVIGLFREFLLDAVGMFWLQKKSHFPVLRQAILISCIVAVVMLLQFTSPILGRLALAAVPVSEAQILFFGADMLFYNPLMAFICAVVISPVVVSCLFYAIGFAPVFNKWPRLAYVVVVVLLGFFQINNNATGMDVATEITVFVTQLPFHLIACWSLRRSNNICVPILTLAATNLLSCLVLFVMTLFA